MSEPEPSPPLTLFAEDSPAKTSVSRDRVTVSPASVQGSTGSSCESFADFDRATSSWRTSQLSLDGGLACYSENWPRSGTMRNGHAFRRSTWVPRISATDCSLWPTPLTTYDGRSDEAWVQAKARAKAKHLRGEYAKGTGAPGMFDLQRAVRLWATPSATMGDRGGRGDLIQQVRGNPSPSGHFKLWTTPTADDTGHRKAKYAQGGTALSMQAGGSLNPTWVEWLMGFPLGWTVLEPSETPSSRKSRKSSGK